MKDFIPYENAVALKELGFDADCFGMYSKNGSVLPLVPYTSEDKAILYQQAFRFFREKYKLDSYIKHEVPDVEAYYEIVIGDDVFDVQYDTYEDAEHDCLKKLIEIVKQKQ